MWEEAAIYLWERRPQQPDGHVRWDTTTRTDSVSMSKSPVFICKIFVFVSVFIDKYVYKATKCENGWVPWQGYCYNLYGTQMKEKKSYAEAQQECVTKGAQLASIHTLEEMHMLTVHFTGSRHSLISFTTNLPTCRTCYGHHRAV